MGGDQDSTYMLRLKGLRETLEEIGRIKQSIKPTALIGYEMLFACQEVKRRAGPHPTQTALARAAHSALKEAIAALPTPRDQLIAQAILAAETKYEGRKVDERKRTLDEDHGIDVNVYKRCRPHILDLLAQYLMQHEPRDPAPTGDIVGYTESLENLKCLFWDVARLRHRSIAYLFVTNFDGLLSASNGGSFHLRRHPPSICDALYKAYLELVLSTGYCLDDALYSCRTKILANLPAEVLSEISTMLGEVLDLMPFDSSGREHICENRYKHVLSLSNYRDRLAVAYVALWKPWMQDNLHFGQADANEVVEKIVTGCNQLLLLARKSLNIHVDDHSLGGETVEIVATYYGTDASVLVLNDKSLLDYCERYFADRNITMMYEEFASN
jgi:hypothetical protein